MKAGKICYNLNCLWIERTIWGIMLNVNMFGKFQVVCDDKILDGDQINSMMLMKLFVYMILRRDKALSVDEIAMALWREEETDNPAGALKNLMYRLRTLLKKQFGEQNFILTNRGSYQWNPEIEISLDVEQFEKISESAKIAQHTEEKKELYEAAIELYKGDFMPKMADLHWSVTLTTYYHSLFLACVKGLAEIYKEQQCYDELEILANRAILQDNVEELFYYYLIYARMEKNQINLALESYEKACEILYEELGVHNPERLQEVYEELLKKNKSVKAEDISEIQEDMLEENPSGTFFCGYPVFKEIYRLEARKIMRIGGAEYVLLLTLNVPGSTKDSEKIGKFRMQKAMEKMEEVISTSLRNGDVAAKYSDSQFVILLPFCSYESGMLVAERIISNFYKEYKKFQSIKIKVNLEEVASAETIVSE